MKGIGKRELVLFLVAVLMLFGSVICFAVESRPALSDVQVLCSVKDCPHTAEVRCPALAVPTFSYNGAAVPGGKSYYYSQLDNVLAKKALDALDACFNPQKSDLPVPRLGVIEVYGLPADLTQEDLTAIRQQVIDILCIDRPEYLWMDKDNLRFGLQSGAKSSTLVMDLSDRILNTYGGSLSEAWEEGKAADAAAKAVLAQMPGGKDDVARLRALHDAILETSEFTYEIEQAYSFTGVLVHHQALCEGYSKTFQLLARRAGYECELVVGYGTRPDGSNELHMWNAVKVNGGWYMVDCTWDDSETLSGGDKYRYFLLNAAELEKIGTHTEDGNINLKTLEDKETPSPEVKVFSFPQLSSVPVN